jgi:hypothetical protein
LLADQRAPGRESRRVSEGSAELLMMPLGESEVSIPLPPEVLAKLGLA